jgi:hypothetical protein
VATNQLTSPGRDTDYFSGANATVIAKADGIAEFVELDIVTIHFSIADNKMPLYGYKSTYFDGVADGGIIVQGRFTLNVTSSNSLNKYLTSSLIYDQNLESSSQSFRFIDGRLFGNSGENANKAGQQSIPALRCDLRLLYHISYDVDQLHATGYEIRDAQITENNLISTAGSEPIGEMYQFIAHNITSLEGQDAFASQV